MASSTIFIKISELEISANSTHFNRVWIACGIFWILSGTRNLWNESLEQSPDDHLQQHKIGSLTSYSVNDIAILFVIGLTHTLGRFFWT